MLTTIFHPKILQADFGRNLLLGRVSRRSIPVFDAPTINGTKIRTAYLDEIFNIYEVAIGEEPNARNRIWFQIDTKAFVQSNFVQPVMKEYQTFVAEIPEAGILGEVTIPFVDAYNEVRGRIFKYRYYYATTFWVLAIFFDNWGLPWYQILDDYNNQKYFLRANAVRIISPDELTPISGAVAPEDKWLYVDLAKQVVTVYEKETPVFMARISSGTLNTQGYYYTPVGQYSIKTKRPCRHMLSRPSGSYTGFDLPGVPWVSYFTGDGIAFHGAYWHNNFGTPMSHGCINMSPQASKWIYLWTNPVVPYDEYYYVGEQGTRVKVV